MHWYEDESFKTKLANDEVRKSWADAEAMEVFASIADKLPEDLRNKSRVGPLFLAPIEGIEGQTHCWMYPVDGSKFQGVILGVSNKVKLIDSRGKIYFEGTWGDTTAEVIESEQRFYVWVEPIQRQDPKVFKIGIQ